MRVGSDSGFEWEKGRNLTKNMQRTGCAGILSRRGGGGDSHVYICGSGERIQQGS